MKERKLFLLLLFLAINIAFPQGNNKLDELSLEDLLNIEVVTASKKGEKLADAPAVVSVITRDEINSYGYKYLGDVLDRATGLFFMGSAVFPQNMMVLRGGASELYNTQVLFMIDGRPVRESFNSGHSSTMLLSYPVKNIERIEIIRGPGSVLYGTSAYLGVVNVITKTGDEGTFSAEFEYGSFKTTKAEINGGVALGDLKLTTGMFYFDSDGWDFTARGESDIIRNKANTADSVVKLPSTVKYFQRNFGLSFQAVYKDVKVNSFYGKTRQEDMGRTPVWSAPLDYAYGTDHLFIDASYKKDITSFWSATLNFTHNNFKYTFYRPIGSYKDDIIRRKSADYLFEFTNFFTPMEKLNLIVGIVSNSISGEGVQPDLKADGIASFKIDSAANPSPFIVVPAYKQNLFTGYFQFDYTPLQFVKIIAGGQLNKVPNIKADFVPRFGTVFTINEQLRAKVLYAQAFRSSSAFEMNGVSLPSVYGNPELLPEKIATLEGQVSYSTGVFEASLTYFNSKQTNQITRSLTTDSLKVVTFQGKLVSVPMYINRGELMMQGFEFEGKYNFSKELRIVASLATQTNEDQNGKKDIFGTPKLMGKIGVSYNSPYGINLAVYNSYFGKGGDITVFDSKGNPTTKKANSDVAAFNYLSVNIELALHKLMNLKTVPEMVFHFYGENLLDAGIYYPEYARKIINSFPGRPGRSFYGGIKLSI